ncbi:hypothetical protein [Streptomyces sp. 150FB]|nr:hypothetical protein [Streptomyces sp. 150FB]
MLHLAASLRLFMDGVLAGLLVVRPQRLIERPDTWAPSVGKGAPRL